MTIQESREAALRRYAECRNHVIDVSDGGNNWCQTCDTGECADCAQPAWYDDENGGEHYRHLFAPWSDCFLIQGTEDEPERIGGAYVTWSNGRQKITADDKRYTLYHGEAGATVAVHDLATLIQMAIQISGRKTTGEEEQI